MVRNAYLTHMRDTHASSSRRAVLAYLVWVALHGNLHLNFQNVHITYGAVLSAKVRLFLSKKIPQAMARWVYLSVITYRVAIISFE